VTTSALDPSTFDPTVSPADDLFRHVNGPWLASTQIADDKPAAGAFSDLRDEAEEAVRDIVTGLAADSDDPTERQIAGLYASFLDTDAVEALGADPLREPLDRIEQVSTPSELLALLGELGRTGVPGLFGWDVDADPGQPTRELLFLGQGGLGLPDEEYYRLDEHADVRAKYVEHVAASLELAGLQGAPELAAAIMDLETSVAACHWDKVRTRDMVAMYNLTTLADLEAATSLDLVAWRAGAHIDDAALAETVVMQPSFFSEVGALLTAETLPVWKTWAAWRVVSSRSPYLSQAFVDERFRFYGTALTGQPVIKPRWKRGVELVERALGEAVGRIYVDRHFPAAAKQRMDELVGNLIGAYRRSITELDWMTDETREKALDKLAKFRPMIGYPSKWRDYSPLVIDPADLVGNVARANAYEQDYQLGKVGKATDREEWLMTPQTVNAYYHPLRNVIVFPAAILQPPFFSADADDAVNYGGIGAVIGHEIGHGFDDQGSTCDGDGRLVDWWTDADRKAFTARTKALIDQYNVLEPAQTPGRHVNGELTIGENIGDLGGLSIAVKAWRIATDGEDPDPIDDLTGLQRLFLNWGVIWQSKMRDEAILQRLAVDPHSPSEFRCNQTVRNVPEFYEAFNVSERNRLFLDEADRVKIW